MTNVPLTINRISNNILKKSQHKIYIESHRGVNKEYEQNTLKAFNKAIEYKVDGIELDIWLTQDLVPIVLHGGSEGELEEFTDHEGFVTEYYLKDLNNVKSKFGKEKIPTLEEVFILCKNKLFINIEIKDNRNDKVFPVLINLIEKYDIQNQIQISSFFHIYYFDNIKKYNEEHEKKIEFGFLYPPGILKYFYGFKYIFNIQNCTLNIFNQDITKEMCEKAHKNNMGIMAWFKMNDIENFDIYSNLYAIGVDVICSNYPKLLLEFRNKVEKGEIIPKIKNNNCHVF